MGDLGADLGGGMRGTLIHERVDGTGYEALVAAHSRALRAVSAEIAATVRSNRRSVVMSSVYPSTPRKTATDI